jgi:hypothetical protein
MKKIYSKFIILMLAIGIGFSCEEEFQTLDSGSYFVQFGQLSRDATESVTTIKVPITLAAPKQGSEVAIQYQITGTAVEGVDYEFDSEEGSASIGTGSFADTVVINLLNDFEADGTKTLVLELTSASNGLKTGIGALGKKFTLNIADDDCAFDINDFVGAYTIEITSEAAFGNPAGLYVSETTLKLGNDPNTLIDENFWDFGPNSVVITLDPSDPANLIAKLVGTQFVYNNAVPLPRYAKQGTQPFGSFNTCEAGLVVKMELTRENQTTVANRSVIKYIKK